MMGICGDNCRYCPRYIATQEGGKEALERVKELWVRLGLREPDFPAGHMACQGCPFQNKCAYAQLRACILDKGIESCGVCGDYPCKHMAVVFKTSDTLKAKAAMLCSAEEMDSLDKAFFSKKDYFDAVKKHHDTQRNTFGS